MRRVSLLAAAALLLVVTQSPAFDAVGHIKKVDAEGGVLYIHANGQDRTVKIDKEAKVLGTDGAPRRDSTQPPTYQP